MRAATGIVSWLPRYLLPAKERARHAPLVLKLIDQCFFISAWIMPSRFSGNNFPITAEKLAATFSKDRTVVIRGDATGASARVAHRLVSRASHSSD